MKISNLKRTKLISYISITFCILSLTGVFASENSMLKLVFFLFFITTLLMIINLRGIEIENSGECFSLKKVHPFAQKKYACAKIEFPLSLIHELHILQGLFVNRMDIKIRGDHSQKSIRIRLPLFTKHQVLKIRKLLDGKSRQGITNENLSE